MSRRPTITLHCTCGASMALTFVRGVTPARMQRSAMQFFATAGHTGDGHALCDKATASKGQRRVERAAGQEELPL